jgi:hypothetical protein
MKWLRVLIAKYRIRLTLWRRGRAYRNAQAQLERRRKA